MTKLIDKLWNWGHLEGSHNQITGLNCSMSPEQYAEEYGIKNAFIVSYRGNIQPPYNEIAKRLSSLNQIKWSVLGDASTPEPDAELGFTEDILDVLEDAPNITGGVVDDFFVRPVRAERFPPEVLKKIKKALNDKGLDFWCVVYNHQLDEDLEKYKGCFDGITFWIWECDNIVHLDEYMPKVFSLANGNPVMCGVYVWDFSTAEGKPMDINLFDRQVSKCFDMLKSKEIEGVIFCSSTLGDAELETNKLLKKYIAEQGDIEIE